MIKKLDAQLPKYVEFLSEIFEREDLKPVVLISDTFQMLSENATEIQQNWDKVRRISPEELKCQVRM